MANNPPAVMVVVVEPPELHARYSSVYFGERDDDDDEDDESQQYLLDKYPTDILCAQEQDDQQVQRNKHSFLPSLDTGLEQFPAYQEPLNSSLRPSFLSSRGRSSHNRNRSLTDAFVFPPREMTEAAQAPGSPPDLSSSRSSKSSSQHSSSFSGNDANITDLSNFETIGLSDENVLSLQELYGNNRLGGKVHTFPKTNGISNQVATLSGARELTIATKKSGFSPMLLPARPMSSHSLTQSLNLPLGSGGRKSFNGTSSKGSLGIKPVQTRNLSRSPSPTPSIHRPHSPRANLISSPNLNSGASAFMKKNWRKSWQPSRKTTKELEAEYHDSDEDLPEDASLWNVPMSPSMFKTMSTDISPTGSASTSPERKYPATAPTSRRGTGLSAGPPHTASINPSSIIPTLHRGASTSVVPDQFGTQKSRIKSWTCALSDLSEEAILLSEALEAHAFESSRKVEEKMQKGMLTSRPSIEKLARAKTVPIEIPPLRKGEIMVDPLPISKEKEKVLSRTRPSWLPPKSQKEEKKHLKEYQRMMELSIEAEKRKAAELVSLQCAHDDTKAALSRIWEEHVLPNWERVIREPRTRELWWRGIAPRSRGEVWQRAIGNDLALTDATYTKALQHAKDMEKEIDEKKSEEVPHAKLWFDAIRRDVEATFPDLKIFQSGGPLHSSLTDVLMAYSMYRSDIGYVYGTHLPAALLLLTLPTPNATFTALANILNRPIPLSFLTADAAGIAKTYGLVMNLLNRKLPKLYTHLFNSREEGGLEMLPNEVFESMICTLFLRGSCESISPPSATAAGKARTKSEPTSPTSSLPPPLPTAPGLPLDIGLRLWDVLVFDGDSMIIRSCVGILACLESQLYGSRTEVLQVLGWGGKAGWSLRFAGGGMGRGGFRGDSGVSVAVAVGDGAGDGFLERVRGVGKM